MGEFEERYWQAPDGVRLFARDYAAAGGEARLPVICIHGLTRNSRDFEELAPLLAATGRRVLTVDVRGRGRSGWSADPMRYQLPTYVRDTLALLDTLAVARAHFIGTSMGGLIMMLLAARQGRALASAILNDVGPAIDPAGIARIAAYAGRTVALDSWDDAVAYFKRTSAVAFPDLSEAGWRTLAERGCIADTEGRPQFDYDPSIAVPIRAKPPPRGSLLTWLLFLKLARWRPTLLIRGELSDLLSRPIADRMRRAAPHMAYTEVQGVGHAPLLSEEGARQAILEFLEPLP
ncbi:MAG: alpha/beta fold hydrolase [Sphingopyxis sp.]|uniref:alpha/beta fold hydrolase n=1 Tax=Sphingopyxis sp. TaxID=1908224 RepID=UPI0032EFC888